MLNEIKQIIVETICVLADQIDNSIPLNQQSDIDSLDCIEVELDIETRYQLKFEFQSLIAVDSTVLEVVTNVQALINNKSKIISK